MSSKFSMLKSVVVTAALVAGVSGVARADVAFLLPRGQARGRKLGFGIPPESSARANGTRNAIDIDRGTGVQWRRGLRTNSGVEKCTFVAPEPSAGTNGE